MTAFAPRRHLLVAHCREAVCRYYRIRPSRIKERTNAHRIAHPRQTAMALAFSLCHDRSYGEVAMGFGGRDHTTVIHAITAVVKRRKEDPDFDMQYDALRLTLATYRGQRASWPEIDGYCGYDLA